VKTATAGIGHGAAAPALRAASSPAGTDSGTLMPPGPARKLPADWHRAAYNGCTGECERRRKQYQVRICVHQIVLSAT